MNYFFVIDGVAGGVGSFQFGIFPVITGINDIASNSDLVSVYPSPASGQLAINLSSTLNKGTAIEIYNSMGSLVNRINNVNISANVDVSNFAVGVYTIKVIDGSRILCKRFSVVK